MNKLKLPYPKTEYFINEDDKVIWLRGSLTRAWALNGLRKRYGYEFKLATQEYINNLKTQ